MRSLLAGNPVRPIDFSQELHSLGLFLFALVFFFSRDLLQRIFMGERLLLVKWTDFLYICNTQHCYQRVYICKICCSFFSCLSLLHFFFLVLCILCSSDFLHKLYSCFYFFLISTQCYSCGGGGGGTGQGWWRWRNGSLKTYILLLQSLHSSEIQLR